MSEKLTDEFTIHWEPLINNAFEERCKNSDRTLVIDHPLKPTLVTERVPLRRLSSQCSTGQTTPVTTPSAMLEPIRFVLERLDPLTEFASQEMDPLSKMAAEMEIQGEKPSDEKSNKPTSSLSSMQPWSSRRAAIIAKFTTSEKLSIITSFLSDGEKVVVKAQSTAVDKVQHRLEQLDYFEEGSQRKLDLSQAEYVGRIEQLNRELVNAWNSEQKVKSLKIAIQCAKLLADTDVLHFYPSKFVLITDILDIFGQLVYQRLRTKAEYYKPGSKVSTLLPEDFTPDMVPESAKETCLNWFYKIASIRELVPRLYVEMALLKSYRFISSYECSEALQRLTLTINGIGNPLVAIYARCYLCRVGINMSQENNSYLNSNFMKFLESYHHLFSRRVKGEIQKQNMELSVYMTLFTPALDFILEAVAINSPESLLEELLDKCCKQGNSSLILNSIMSAFKPSAISPRTLQILEMICQTFDEGIPLHVLLRTLGLCVSVCPPPSEHRKLILSTVWKHISSFTTPDNYVSCVEVWIEYAVRYFTNRQLNTILGDIVKHLSHEKNNENCYNSLKLIVDKILLHIRDFEGLLDMDNFLPFIDLFQPKSLQEEVVKKILNSCITDLHTSDPVITNTLMFLCSILHDSVNALTPEDEHRQIGEILCNVVKRVDFGRDFEYQLNFYVQARGAFSNIDAVLAQLVQCVNKLAVNTRQIVKGFHTRKTGDFVRACAAYCFITIPSIVSVQTRLQLYLLSGQVALFNQCLGQADACFKAALSIIPELEIEKAPRNEKFLVSYVKQFLSILLIVPDNPEDQQVLKLPKQLFTIIKGLPWDKEQASIVTLYCSFLDFLTAMAQDTFPYHIERVESNDSLYGSDVRFVSDVNKFSGIVCSEIISHLKQMGPCRKQSQGALEFFTKIMTRSDLHSEALLALAGNLWSLITKHGFLDSESIVRTKQVFNDRIPKKVH